MKQNKNQKKIHFNENEKEFDSLLYMTYDIAWEMGGTYDFMFTAGDISFQMQRNDMDGVILFFEEGINSARKVLTEKKPEVKFERIRKYFDRNAIEYFVMRRRLQNPDDNWNIISDTRIPRGMAVERSFLTM